MSDAEATSATQILADLREGDPSAAGRLMEVVYGQLRALAGSYFRHHPPDHTLQPTALVHEAFIEMVDQTNVQWKDRAHFFAVCAVVMRRLLADHARRRHAAKRGGGWQRVTLSDLATPDTDDLVDVIALDAALSKLATLHERQARIVECRFFGGMTEDEVAEALGVSRRTVSGEWRMARAWLSLELSRGDEE